ncbi:DNA/RNA non-specific endonuclease [Kitasatospora sp. RG8]|uniref:DNA/RNA non-specific endonuclease n=1 Tax=Kitasatospora sp. RG8 TaxID=2820815 RepID=UPI001ADFCB99|nr:DNA/RNA non-specific endonuclease [Kitasatospora sp. RG8]MBP0449286.1 DNA/RNA non-specific endonuclease [Kitasatospora sp. RG8]
MTSPFPDPAQPDGQAGYDPAFLGPIVPLPHPTDPDIALVTLPYTHFTVLLRPDRRLAAATAVGIDGGRLVDLKREGQWRLDPRVPEAQQVGEALYADNDFDRGHLVRRLDPVWGDDAEVRAANADTFHFTNAAPQHAAFNQGKQLWAGLEDFLLTHAATFDRKLVVLTGPVLRPADPVYRKVRIPLAFWKVVAFLQDGALAATAYVLDQSPDLPNASAALAAAEAADQPPPLGAYRTFQVPVSDVADITALDLGPLPAVDLLPAPPSPAPTTPGAEPGPDRWRPLGRHEDIVLGPPR